MPKYDTRRWVQEDLIDVKDVDDPSDDSLSAQNTGIGCGFWLLIYLVIAIMVPVLRNNYYTWMVFGGFLHSCIPCGLGLQRGR